MMGWGGVSGLGKGMFSFLISILSQRLDARAARGHYFSVVNLAGSLGSGGKAASGV